MGPEVWWLLGGGVAVVAMVRWRARWLLAALAIVVAVGWRGGPPARLEDMPECPHDWADSLREGWPTSGELAVAGANTSVPEYHDCQRFLRKSSLPWNRALRYDSLYAIFARYRLDSVYADGRNGLLRTGRQFFPNRAPGALAGGDSTVPVSLFDATAQPAGARLITIGITYSEGNYRPLALQRGFQCVMLLWTGGYAAPRYRAWLVRVPHDRHCMRIESLDRAKATELQVRVTMPASEDRVPPVARWDWNPARREQYIGIMCPTGWCELHRTTPHTPSPAHAVPTGLAGADGALVRVKGWYDEQLLASTRGWRHGVDGTRGTVYPEPELAADGLAEYRGRWRPAARISANPFSLAYKKKANFGGTAGPGGVTLAGGPSALDAQATRVELCHVPTGGAGCRDAASGVTSMPTARRHDGTACPATPKAGRWFARLTAPDGAVKHACVIYRPTKDGSQPPSVVRWRWSTRDELIWIECPVGCCEVEVDGT